MKKILSARLSRIARHSKPSDFLVLLGMAILVGISTGLLAVLFINLIQLVRAFSLQIINWLGHSAGLLLTMAAAGLIVGYLIHRWTPEASGRGIPEVMEAVALQKGHIPARVILTKLVATSITLGAGGSAGRQGPIVQIGAALGSTMGRIIHFSSEQRRTIVACGAAAGVSAAFNAPIAGSIFALEVVLGKLSVRYFSAVVISAASAAIVGRIFFGDLPTFDVPIYSFQLNELILFVLFGLLAGLLAVVFVRSLGWSEKAFDRLRLPAPFTAALGMLLTGLVILVFPGDAISGSGLSYIGATLIGNWDVSTTLLSALLVAKIVATCLTLGSGNSGGVFAPLLFIGSVAGLIFGKMAHSFWPEVALFPEAFAIVGMSAVFAAATRAPITAVLIVFEMSNDYRLILPLMLASVIATVLAEYIFPESIYTLKLRKKGIHFRHGRDYDLMHGVTVSEIMTRDPYVVSCNMPIEQLRASFRRTGIRGFPVVNEKSNLAGVVSLSDYQEAIRQDDAATLRVRDIATMDRILLAYEDEPLSDALERMATREVSRLPVVSREEPQRIKGLIRHSDIIKAYKLALSRQEEGQIDDSRLHLKRTDKMKFVEIVIQNKCRHMGKTVAILAPELPYDCVIVSNRRHGVLLVPHGDMIIMPGDILSFFVLSADEERLRACFEC